MTPALPRRHAVASANTTVRPRVRPPERRPAGAGAVAVLRNGLGHYDEAVEAATEAARTEHPGIAGWALVELVEAAARSGRTALAGGRASS